MRQQQFATLFAFLCLFSASVLAQQPLPADRDLIRDRQERLLEEQRKRIEELQQLPGREAPAEHTQPAQDERCLEIKSIKLQGVSLLSESAQQELLKPFLNRCLGANRLNQLLKAITQYYLDRGYVTTRAYLPQQDLASGTLQVTVVEGQLEGLNRSELASERELAMSFPGTTGRVLNLRELEQLVEQLGRLPSRQTQLELVPGEQVGGSRVQLQGQRSKPWRVSLARHNDGQRSTGEQQWGLGLDWDSPLGLADQLSLRGGGDTVSDHWRHSANQSLYYSLPYGWWTFSYNYSQSDYRTLNESNGFAFDTDGESKIHALRGERVLHRDSLSKTAASLGISHLRSNNFILGSRIDVSSQRLTEGQLGFNHGRRVGSAFINADFGWQHGTGAFDAQRSGNPHGGAASGALQQIQPDLKLPATVPAVG